MKKKIKTIYHERFGEHTIIDQENVIELVIQNKDKLTTEILERGKRSDESEFVVIKFIVNK